MTEKSLGKFKGIVCYLKYPRGQEIFTPTLLLYSTETFEKEERVVSVLQVIKCYTT